MNDAEINHLENAIDRNAPLVLSLPLDGRLHHHKSRFLGRWSDGFWVESAPGVGERIDHLIASGDNCGISFRNGDVKMIFSTTAMRRDARHRINETVSVEAVLLRRPETIKAVQRRDHYRAHIPIHSDWPRVKIWRMGMKAELSERPMDAQAIHAQIRDLSATGMGAILSGEGNEPPKFHPSDRLRIEIRHQDRTLLMEGCIRYPSEPPKQPSVRVGIEFMGLEATVENRRIKSDLIRIVGDLQREEIRRHHMGLPVE